MSVKRNRYMDVAQRKKELADKKGRKKEVEDKERDGTGNAMVIFGDVVCALW